MPEHVNLPSDVAATLAPHLRHALDSPPRRRILRALNTSADAQTLEDLGEVVPATSTSTLSYHLKVLEKKGCISEASQIVRANGTERAYASNIADNRAVMEVLRATQREDDGLDG